MTQKAYVEIEEAPRRLREKYAGQSLDDAEKPPTSDSDD
jgi:hypothetical protein